MVTQTRFAAAFLIAAQICCGAAKKDLKSNKAAVNPRVFQTVAEFLEAYKGNRFLYGMAEAFEAEVVTEESVSKIFRFGGQRGVEFADLKQGLINFAAFVRADSELAGNLKGIENGGIRSLKYFNDALGRLTALGLSWEEAEAAATRAFLESMAREAALVKAGIVEGESAHASIAKFNEQMKVVLGAVEGDWGSSAGFAKMRQFYEEDQLTKILWQDWASLNSIPPDAQAVFTALDAPAFAIPAWSVKFTDGNAALGGFSKAFYQGLTDGSEDITREWLSNRFSYAYRSMNSIAQRYSNLLAIPKFRKILFETQFSKWIAEYSAADQGIGQGFVTTFRNGNVRAIFRVPKFDGGQVVFEQVQFTLADLGSKKFVDFWATNMKYYQAYFRYLGGTIVGMEDEESFVAENADDDSGDAALSDNNPPADDVVTPPIVADDTTTPPNDVALIGSFGGACNPDGTCNDASLLCNDGGTCDLDPNAA